MLCSGALSASAFDRATGIDKANLQRSAASQNRVDQLDDRRREMLEDYLQTQRRIELLQLDNRQLQVRVDAQRRQIDNYNNQLQSIEIARLGLLPLMEQMESALVEFVQRDLPFLPQERGVRIQRLATADSTAATSIEARFRQMLETYLVELEYGRTIEYYQDTLKAPGSSDDGKTVDFFRLGRLGLYYLTMDSSSGGVWHRDSDSFVALHEDRIDDLERALKIAHQAQVPQFVSLPLPAPTAAAQ